MKCCDIKPKKNQLNDQNHDFSCPQCGSKGSKIQIVTLKSILKDCSLINIKEDLSYRYCKSPNCEVAYFSYSPDYFFRTDELKKKATVKDQSMDVHVCYCFDHTRQSILDEIIETGISTVVDSIKTQMKDPGCFCEKSNPQGGCCLANIIDCVKEATKKASK